MTSRAQINSEFRYPIPQAYAESVPIVVLLGDYPRHLTNIFPNFRSFLNYRHVTKWIDQVTIAALIPEAMRRAFTQVKNGLPGPVLVEIPGDVFNDEVPGPVDYSPTVATRSARDPETVKEVAHALVKAERPVIYAGQGIHYARAWEELQQLARASGSTGNDEFAG